MKTKNINNLKIDVSEINKVYFNKKRVYNIVFNDNFIWVDKLNVIKKNGNPKSK